MAEVENQRKWYFPLIAFSFVLCFYAPFKAYYFEKIWFPPSIEQILPAVILLFLVAILTGYGLGFVLSHYNSVLQGKKQLIFGLVIGGILCGYLIWGIPLIVLVVLILFIGELMFCNQSFPNIYADILSGTALAIFVQICFLDQELPLMNTLQVWDEKSRQAALSLIIWIICLMGPVVLRLFCGKKLQKWIHLTLGCGVSVAAFALTVLIFCGVGIPKNGRWFVVKEGEFELSSEENIVVFAMEQLDGSWVEKYIAEEPKFAEMLNGFVLFNNAVAPSSTSRYNLPALLTGKVNTGTEDQKDYYSEIYTESTLMSDLTDNGYDVRIYSDKEHLVNNTIVEIPACINNLTENPDTDITSFGILLKDVIHLTGYYAAPYQIKKGFILNVKDTEKDYPFTNSEKYKESYLDFRKDYITSGLTVDENVKKFRLYYLDGVYSENEEKKGSSDISLQEELNKRFTIINNYIEELKEKDLFDQTTIIVFGMNGARQLRQNPAVMIKMKGSQDEYQISDAPITFDHIRATIVAGLDKPYYYGDDVLAAEKSDRNTARMVIVEKDIRNEYYDDQLPINHSSRFLVGGKATDEKSIFEAQIPPTNDYLLNDPIIFWREGARTDIGSGLSNVEPGLRWTETSGVCMKFHINETYDDLQIHLYYNWAYVLPQRIFVYANQRLIYNNTHDGYYPIEFVVPHEWVNNGDLELIICLPDAMIPAMISDSADTRRLGLSLDTMMIESVPRKTETVLETSVGE